MKLKLRKLTNSKISRFYISIKSVQNQSIKILNGYMYVNFTLLKLLSFSMLDHTYNQQTRKISKNASSLVLSPSNHLSLEGLYVKI